MATLDEIYDATPVKYCADSMAQQQRLQIDDGDVLFIMSDEVQDHLVIRSSTLKSIGRFKQQFGDGAHFEPARRSVIDPRDKQKKLISVINLELVIDAQGGDKKQVTFMLADGKSKVSTLRKPLKGHPDEHNLMSCFKDFSDSDYVTGFCSVDLDIDPNHVREALRCDGYYDRSTIGRYNYDAAAIHRRAVLAWKILMCLLEGVPATLDVRKWDDTRVRDLTRTMPTCVAYAEYNEFLPNVANGLPKIYENIGGLEQDVFDHPLFHIATAIKLRSELHNVHGLLAFVQWLQVELIKTTGEENIELFATARKVESVQLDEMVRAICKHSEEEIGKRTVRDGPVLDEKIDLYREDYPWDGEEPYPTYKTPPEPQLISHGWAIALDSATAHAEATEDIEAAESAEATEADAS